MIHGIGIKDGKLWFRSVDWFHSFRVAVTPLELKEIVAFAMKEKFISEEISDGDKNGKTCAGDCGGAEKVCGVRETGEVISAEHLQTVSSGEVYSADEFD